MAIFSSGSEARLGSLGILPTIPCPPLPNIVAEWAAILPLACHLASQRDDYIATGEIALLGRLSVGLFPRLGTLSGLARLLGTGTKFLDYASTRGGSSRTVWDVKWGSVFPCANGAASAAISRCLRSRNIDHPQRMPETLPRLTQGTDTRESSRQSSFVTQDGKGDPTPQVPLADDEPIRRRQLLHVYRFHLKGKRSTLKSRFNRLRLSTPVQAVWCTMLICFAVVLGFFGAYGTAVIVVCTSISELIAQLVPIRRPSGYLKNNETHDACMLAASHENATEWHLYVGDRAIVDSLLNKPMFVVPEGRSTHIIAGWFSFAHLLQLGAMTFVAAQKGWDGVCLVALLSIHWALHWLLRGQTLAGDWLDNEGIGAEVKSFEVGGRTAMVGAIQVFSGSDKTTWIDKIMVPHPRREAWLQRLQGEDPEDGFDQHDTRWIELSFEASLASAEMLQKQFGVGETENAPA